MAAFTGPNIANLLVVVGNAVPATDLRPRFTPSEGASFSSYDLKKLDTAVARTTATALGTASQTLPVASVASITEGTYIQVGGGAPVRVLIVSTDGLALYLAEPRTWTNGAAVVERPVVAQVIAGVTFNGVWGGSPSGAAVFAETLVRGTGSDGDTPDSNLFTFTASPAPNPPVFDDENPVDSHNFVIGDGTKIVAYGSHFSLGGAVVSYAVRPGDPALPASMSLNFGTGDLTITQVNATWTGAIRGTNADGSDDSNVTTQTMAPPSSSLEGHTPLRMGSHGTIGVQRNRRVSDHFTLMLRPGATLLITRERRLIGSTPLYLIPNSFAETSHGPATYTVVGHTPIRFRPRSNFLVQKAPSYVARALYEFAPELRLYTFFSGEVMNTVYLGRDNSFPVGLLSRSSPVSAAAFTRFVLYMQDADGNTITVDEAVSGYVFNRSESGFFYGESVPVLRLKLGLGSLGLVAGKTYQCYLRCYDAINTNGLVWPEDNQRLPVTVLSGP